MPKVFLSVFFCVSTTFFLGATPTAYGAPAPQNAGGDVAPQDAAAAQKAVRALINAIRYNKDDLAASKLNFKGMASLLLGETWSEATPTQQNDFVHDLKTLVTRTSFPKGREMFAYLDALLFEAAQKCGDTMHVKSVVVVHRNLKKVELPIEWVLAADKGAWQVVDIISMNESTAAGIRSEEVLPLLQEGGLSKLLATLHERVAKLPPVAQPRAPAP
jgi:ABC-type transporter MlaC component